MKIAIISDTHDNLANFNKIIGWLNSEKIGLLLHCGDIACRETLNEAEKNFKGEIKAVSGNCDLGLIELRISEKIDFEGKKIGFTHYPETAKRMAVAGKYDLVFYGHTHKPWEEKIGKCRLVNPGNADGSFFKATFAVYDAAEDKIELKILEKNLI